MLFDGSNNTDPSWELVNKIEVIITIQKNEDH